MTAAEQHQGGDVIPLRPAPADDVPKHLRDPMPNALRRRTAERGIANARQALTRARIREVGADG